MKLATRLHHRLADQPAAPFALPYHDPAATTMRAATPNYLLIERPLDDCPSTQQLTMLVLHRAQRMFGTFVDELTLARYSQQAAAMMPLQPDQIVPDFLPDLALGEVRKMIKRDYAGNFARN